MKERLQELLARIEDDVLREEFRRELERGGEIEKPKSKLFITLETVYVRQKVMLNKGTILRQVDDLFFLEKGRSSLSFSEEDLRGFILSGKLRALQ